MKKSLIFSSAVALAMLINNSAYAAKVSDFGIYVCNLSKRTIHFKKSYYYQANTNDDYSQDFVVAPNNCSGSVNFKGNKDWYPGDNDLQWVMTDANTGENLGRIDYFGDGSNFTNSQYMRFGIGSAQLSFIDYPKDSIIKKEDNTYDYRYYTLNPKVSHSQLPFSHRTTNWFEHVYSDDIYDDQTNVSRFSYAVTGGDGRGGRGMLWGVIQITDSIPESAKTYEDFALVGK